MVQHIMTSNVTKHEAAEMTETLLLSTYCFSVCILGMGSFSVPKSAQGRIKEVREWVMDSRGSIGRHG